MTIEFTESLSVLFGRQCSVLNERPAQLLFISKSGDLSDHL